jgi:hypothetical protein
MRKRCNIVEVNRTYEHPPLASRNRKGSKPGISDNDAAKADGRRLK